MSKFLNKKTLLFTFVVLVLGTIAYLYIVGNRETQSPQEITPQEVETPAETPPAAKIIVGEGIFVDNFKTQASPLPGGDSKISDEENFEIIYFEKFDSFLISILKQPFETHRQLAEQEFLRRLGIVEVDACRLDVTISSPAFVDPSLGGRNFGLSFCE